MCRVSVCEFSCYIFGAYFEYSRDSERLRKRDKENRIEEMISNFLHVPVCMYVYVYVQNKA